MDELGDGEPSKVILDQAAEKVRNIHRTLTGEQGRLSQVPYGHKCNMSKDLIAICPRLGDGTFHLRVAPWSLGHMQPLPSATPLPTCPALLRRESMALYRMGVGGYWEVGTSPH